MVPKLTQYRTHKVTYLQMNIRLLLWYMCCASVNQKIDSIKIRHCFHEICFPNWGISSQSVISSSWNCWHIFGKVLTQYSNKVIMENKKTFNGNDDKETKSSSSSKNFLPPKKRFIHFEECNNSEETTKAKIEKKNPFDLIQAGVIRHTSQWAEMAQNQITYPHR